MNHENSKATFQILTQHRPSLSEEDFKIVSDWVTSFQLFQPFIDEPQLDHLISSLQPIKLKSGEINHQEDGIELCYVVSGAVIMDLESQLNDIVKKKVKKEVMTSRNWIIRPFPGKNCIILGKDSHSQILALNSKISRKFINKTLTSKWGDLARIIVRQPLFRYLDKETLLEIAKTAKIATHHYNSIIYSKGDQALHSYILLQGNIRILSDNVQVTYLSPEQIFGDEDILGSKAHRQFKAICASEKVKLMRIEKAEIEKALAVLTVLGKEKSVQKYVNSKNDYRRTISFNMKKLLSFREEEPQVKESEKISLPLYKYKRQSLGQYSFYNPQTEEKKISSRFLDTLKANGLTVIRSSDKSPTGKTFYGGRSIDGKAKSKRVELFKLPHLTKT